MLILAEGLADEPRAVEVLSPDLLDDLLDALAYAHERGWRHGALDPSRLLTNARGTRVCLLDLGVRELLGAEDLTPEADISALLDLARALRPSNPEAGAEVDAWVAEAQHDLTTGAAMTARTRSRRAERSQRPNTPPGEGAWIDHFRVLRPLGRGGMGEVYLARDTVLGRPVALKLIRSDVLSEEDADRFLCEARTTAAFQHPNIVVLHAAGWWEGRPYLALEYLEGASLRDRLQEGPLPLTEAQRIACAVSAALQDAHARGVVHCDLKPANVMLPRDGRTRVVDFGLARWTQREARSRGEWVGTPAYMAPEQWAGGEPSPASDVFALGLILHEMVAGRRPYEAPPKRGLPEIVPLSELGAPADLSVLVAECLAEGPEARPSAAELTARLGRLVAQAVLRPDDEAPYRGLGAFQERHARFFYGRDAEVSEALEALRDGTRLTVLGPSGAGKTSFVRAGLIPRLRETRRWLVLTLRPGKQPVRALAACVTRVERTTSKVLPELASEITDAWTSQLVADPRLLNRTLHDLAEHRGVEVLLFVDQLEEIATHADAEEASAFLAALSAAADLPTDPVRLVVAVRDDFLGRLALLGGRSDLGSVLLLRPPSADALAQAIEGPATAVGHRFEDAELPRRMAREVSGHAMALPLLQFACHGLWVRRDVDRRTLLSSAYEEIRGVKGALAAHADRVVDELDPTQIRVCRAILLSLIGADGARRLRTREELLEPLPAGGDGVLQRLVTARLVTATRSEEGDAPGVYELVHESLAVEWARLHRWLEETTEDRALLEDVGRAARVWSEGGELAAALWVGAKLDHFEERANALGLSMGSAAQTFLTASRQEDRRRRRRRRIAVVGGLTLAAAITAGSVAAAAVFQQQAERINAAAANLGSFELTLRAFEVDPVSGEERLVPASALPELDFVLREPDRDDPTKPGRPYDEAYVARSERRIADGAWVEKVRARGGPAFLEVRGRGVSGASCAPATIQLKSLPGYAEAQAPAKLPIWFPTCAESARDTVEVPAGPYVSGGAGEPPTRFASYVEPEQILDLPSYQMDRYEVTNGDYARYLRMIEVTGAIAVGYPKQSPYEGADGPDRPILGVTARAAEEYCRFMGKALPSSEQWEKAARGGLELAGGVPNPGPRRNVPWIEGPLAKCANLEGGGDGYPGPSPVGAFAACGSPYGIADLVGNAEEWTSTTKDDEPHLRVLRGASWGSPRDLDLHTVAFDNGKPITGTDYGVGFRCASAQGAAKGVSEEVEGDGCGFKTPDCEALLKKFETYTEAPTLTLTLRDCPKGSSVSPQICIYSGNDLKAKVVKGQTFPNTLPMDLCVGAGLHSSKEQIKGVLTHAIGSTVGEQLVGLAVRAENALYNDSAAVHSALLSGLELEEKAEKTKERNKSRNLSEFFAGVVSSLRAGEWVLIDNKIENAVHRGYAWGLLSFEEDGKTRFVGTDPRFALRRTVHLENTTGGSDPDVGSPHSILAEHECFQNHLPAAEFGILPLVTHGGMREGVLVFDGSIDVQKWARKNARQSLAVVFSCNGEKGTGAPVDANGRLLGEALVRGAGRDAVATIGRLDIPNVPVFAAGFWCGLQAENHSLHRRVQLGRHASASLWRMTKPKNTCPIWYQIESYSPENENSK